MGTPSTDVPAHDEQKAGPFEPKPPKDFQEAGLDPSIVESLILKYILGVGSATGGTIASDH